ncbi:hypothetical protein OE766_12130 [Pararhizobium sp. YC-54]|uniref:hypothetical protein n=1 Tax=Pararhizobium sp. YC-54 TaxID=2986920 RepID=UPI0021F77E87|nr:hypothetical protein [Pararhizobium sp. YC-54]MCV9998997.1 hypothetical protein [Pararhizobium sp. YC-54]
MNSNPAAIQCRCGIFHADHGDPIRAMTEIGKRAVIAYYTPLTRMPFVRATIRLLRRCG